MMIMENRSKKKKLLLKRHRQQRDNLNVQLIQKIKMILISIVLALIEIFQIIFKESLLIFCKLVVK